MCGMNIPYALLTIGKKNCHYIFSPYTLDYVEAVFVLSIRISLRNVVIYHVL